MRHYYEIRHVCGHVDRARIEDTDPMEVRRKIAWLSARRCLECRERNVPKPDMRFLVGAKPVVGSPGECYEADRIRARAIQELYSRAAQARRYSSGKARRELRHALGHVTRAIMGMTDAGLIVSLGDGLLRHAEEETHFGWGLAEARHVEESHGRMVRRTARKEARKRGGHHRTHAPSHGASHRTVEPPISSLPLSKPVAPEPTPEPEPAAPHTVPRVATAYDTLEPVGHPNVPCVSSWPLKPYEPSHMPTQDTLF